MTSEIGNKERDKLPRQVPQGEREEEECRARRVPRAQRRKQRELEIFTPPPHARPLPPFPDGGLPLPPPPKAAASISGMTDGYKCGS